MCSEHNKKYLGLDDSQYERHCKLMEMCIGEWPDGLEEYCSWKSTETGFCGDALAVWVADWIKKN